MGVSYKNADCLICGKNDAKKIGVRGNREYNGADPNIVPHIVTNVVRCKNCGFVYTDPMIIGMEHLEYEHYRNVDKYQSVQENMSSMFLNRVELVKKYISKGHLLDVGSGKGEFLVEAKKQGFEAEGIEPSETFCKYVETTYGIQVQNGLLGVDVHPPSAKYDVVTMLHVLEHVDSPHELLKEIFRVLKPGGYLFIEVPNTASTFLKLIDAYYKLKGLNWSSRLSPLHAPFHKYGYSEKSLSYLLKKNEFLVSDVYTLTGKDRGFDKTKNTPGLDAKLRDLATNIIEWTGNRELLLIVAQKPKDA